MFHHYVQNSVVETHPTIFPFYIPIVSPFTVGYIMVYAINYKYCLNPLNQPFYWSNQHFFFQPSQMSRENELELKQWLESLDGKGNLLERGATAVGVRPHGSLYQNGHDLDDARGYPYRGNPEWLFRLFIFPKCPEIN
jgi:hypothetical protein